VQAASVQVFVDAAAAAWYDCLPIRLSQTLLPQS
jgi:hypothetical protein